MRHIAGESGRVNSADTAQVLQDDEIGGEGGERGEIDEVKAFAFGAFGRDDRVDFGRGKAVGEMREDDVGEGAGFGREIALESDGGDGGAGADGEEDLGGGGEKGADAHGLWQAYLRG